MGGIHLDFDVQHGGQATQALCAYAQRVDFLKQFQAQRLGLGKRRAAGRLGLELVHVQVVHSAFLGHQHRFFSGAANADAQHAGGAPSRTHGGHGFEHPVHHRVAGVEHHHLAFVLGAAAFGRHRDFKRVAGHDLAEDDGGRVVFGVLALKLRVSHYGGAQGVVGVVVGLAHALVDGVVQAAGKAFPAHVHAHFQKHVDDAGVLANGAVAGGAHFAVGQNLRNGVFGGRALLALVGPRQVGNVVRGVVVADVLQGGGNGLDQVGLANRGGGAWGGHGETEARVFRVEQGAYRGASGSQNGASLASQPFSPLTLRQWTSFWVCTIRRSV